MNDKIKMLDVEFEEQSCTYGSGENVRGRVLLQVACFICVKALKVLAGGCEQVSWKRSWLRPLAKRRSDEVQFFSDTQTLLEVADGEQDISVAAGKYEYPFQFELPSRPLPPSFSGKYGSVHYWVKAVLQRPAKPDQVVCKEFPVINNIDISAPALLCPISAHKEKWVRRSFFCQQLISLRVSTSRVGYCSGETVPICAKFENYSSCLVEPKACIYQTQTFLAKGKSKAYRQEIASVRGIAIPPFRAQRWNPNVLKIPSVTASILNSSIIRVEYSLVISLEMPEANLAVDLPIVIGTIPIDQSRYGASSSISSHYSVDLSPLTLLLPQPLKAPPAYEDIVPETEREVRGPIRPEELQREFGVLYSYMEGMRFQPPPLFSEVACFLQVNIEI